MTTNKATANALLARGSDQALELAGNGDPEGNVGAPVGSTFRRLDGGVNTTFYVKEYGASTVNGWVAHGGIVPAIGIAFDVNATQPSGKGKGYAWMDDATGACYVNVGDAGDPQYIAIVAGATATGDMLKADNLSGLANAATARTNLGLGSAAVASTAAFDPAGSAAAAQALAAAYTDDEVANAYANAIDRANHTGTIDADVLVDGTTNHVFTAADDTKLGGIATAATANETDAHLKDRANHTGSQAAATISDLTEVIQDMVATFVVAGTGISKTYDDGANTLTLAATGAATDRWTMNWAFGTFTDTPEGVVPQVAHLAGTIKSVSISAGATDPGAATSFDIKVGGSTVHTVTLPSGGGSSAASSDLDTGLSIAVTAGQIVTIAPSSTPSGTPSKYGMVSILFQS